MEDRIAADFYRMMKSMVADSAEMSKEESFHGELLEKDNKTKDSFIRKSHVSAVTSALIEYLVLVEWQYKKKSPRIRETAIYNSALRLEKTLSKGSVWELLEPDDKNSYEPLDGITNFEVNIMEQILTIYVTNFFKEGGERTFFFPLQDNFAPETVVKWRILEKIASVKVVPHETLYGRNLNECLKTKVEDEVCQWMTRNLEGVDLKARTLEIVLSLTKVSESLNSEIAHARDNYSLIDSLFAPTTCSYWDILADALQQKIIPLCREVMKAFDDYQMKHREFHVNIRESCAIFHRFYLQLKRVVSQLTPYLKATTFPLKKEMKPLFDNSFLNLLHVIQVECHSRIGRAVQDQDKDSLMEEEQIYSSTVIVLNCICTVLDEWKRLEIVDEDMKYAFLIKMTDLICDGSKIFSQSLLKRASSLKHHAKDPNDTKKICAMGNSVHHVLKYLSDLPTMMLWEDHLGVSECDSAMAVFRFQVRRVLELILESMRSDLTQMQSHIYAQAVHRLGTCCERHIKNWLEDHILRPTTHQYVERFLAFVDHQLEAINQYLPEEEFKKFMGQLWVYFLNYIIDNFQEGCSPEHGKTLKESVEELHKYFTDMNANVPEEKKLLYQHVHHMIDLNSKTTLELELCYYGHMADLLISPLEYLGHMAFQAGYMRSSRGTVAIHVKVRKAQRLPLRKFDVDSWNVRIDLRPRAIFPNVRSVKTQTVTESLQNPVFDETFIFQNLPVSVLRVEGAVIEVWLSNQDAKYCANAVLRLAQVANMSGLVSMDFLPVHVIALRALDTGHPSFLVLEKRAKNERQARRFVSSRYDRAKRRETLSCVAGTGTVSGFLRTQRSFRLPWKTS